MTVVSTETKLHAWRQKAKTKKKRRTWTPRRPLDGSSCPWRPREINGPKPHQCRG